MFLKFSHVLLGASLIVSAGLAQDLSFKEGFIQAHTAVLGDSDINPKSSQITAKLSYDDTPESLKGDIAMELLSLKSDNEKRDEHMYEALKAKVNKEARFHLQSVKKQDDGYHLVGTLSLNNVTKPIDAKAQIVDADHRLSLKGDFRLKMTDFNIEPPTLLFLSVRDEVDVNYDLSFTHP
jgi:polyisoprenoid-binding protein YceI